MDGLSGRRRFFALIVFLGCGLLVLLLASIAFHRASPPPAPSARPAASVVAGGSARTGLGTGPSNYRSHCASCHGTGGKGDGWTAWVYRLMMRDLTDAAYLQTLTDDYLFQIIKQGGASLGKPGMPSWGRELDDREIRDLVRHIRSLAAAPRPPHATGSSR